MRIIEIIFAIILLIGALFKVNHYPGASILLIVSIGVLSMIYTYFSFLLLNGLKFRQLFKKGSFKEISAPKIIVSIFAGFSLGTALLGILFRVQIYPGAFVMTQTGLVSTIISIILMAVFHRESLKKNLIRIIPIAILCLFFSQVSDDNMIDFYNRNEPEIARLRKHVRKNPEDYEARMQLDSLLYAKGYKIKRYRTK